MGRRTIRAGAVAVLLVGASVLPARAQDAASPDTTELLREIYEDGHVQRELPDMDFEATSRLAPPETTPSERDSRPVREGAGSTSPDSGEGEGITDGGNLPAPAPLPDTTTTPDGGDFGAANTALQAVGRILFWGVVALIVIVLLLAITRYLRDRVASVAVGDEDEAPRGDTAAAASAFVPAKPRATTRDEAVALADKGSYLEAAHLLLLDGLARCTDAGRRLDRATTAREFLGLLPRDGPERPRVDVLVRTVERGLFAERPLDRGHFDAALGAYDGLLARAGDAS